LSVRRPGNGCDRIIVLAGIVELATEGIPNAISEKVRLG
jgi:hypothetical protein